MDKWPPCSNTPSSRKWLSGHLLLEHHSLIDRAWAQGPDTQVSGKGTYTHLHLLGSTQRTAVAVK